MNCEGIEMLLAEALGGELSKADRSALDAHLAHCDRCRREYESLSRAVDGMRSLPGPKRVTVGRQGRRAASLNASARPILGLRWFSSRVVRFAASVLIAFVAGYASHAGLMMSVPAPQQGTSLQREAERPGENGGRSLEYAVVSAYRQNPARSDLAKCLIAMFDAPRRE